MPFVICGLDIETTGLKQEDGHKIIEIAASLYRTEDGYSFKNIGKWEQRVNPLRPIDAKAQAVHGISLADLKDEPTWDEVAPKMSKILRLSDLVVAHNGDGFDVPFIVNELIAEGEPVPDCETYDTMLEGRDTTPMGKVPSLKEFCWAYGVDYDPEKAHAAMYDVDVMMAAFFAGMKRERVSVPLLDAFRELKEVA